MKRNIFSTDKNAMFFVASEVFLVFLIVIQLYKVLGMSFSYGKLSIFSQQVLPQNILWFVASILTLVILYVSISMKDKKVIRIHSDFSKIVLGTGKEKFFGMDREVITLLFVEFIFAIMLAVAIFVYLDPSVNIVPWPWNYITFFIVLIFGLYFFSKTKPFREAVYGESRLKRISPAKRLFPTRRITNKKTGTIRIGGKKKQTWKKNKTKHRKRLNKKKK
ncbi:MAG: hypothetical protein HON47_03295 [Candidatus Diapherotrites archaeon]|jgi:hypothetical protein|uniref:Uncharacterized protein n=1 Tax=Candidatus Iainarchaeum sp. TaxID=3101447 RepID=A0A8T5GF90_9ARCH|nr:hypothetical protein [Candidatus Diapherotrites archaeon]MBT7241318.1 hypothetical protein [Candidatus Diapherotrites archaeon]